MGWLNDNVLFGRPGLFEGNLDLLRSNVDAAASALMTLGHVHLVQSGKYYGAYAAISRELGCALDFPGPEAAFDSLTDMTSTIFKPRDYLDGAG